MNAAMKQVAPVFRLLTFCLLALAASNVRADLTPKQVRKAITRMTGFELTNGAVRVKSVSQTGPNAAEAVAIVRTAFKFQKDEREQWRVAEIRTGPSHWEHISMIADALGGAEVTEECNAPDPPTRDTSATEPSVKRARCLLGQLLGIDTPSDAVRIQEVSEMELPLASQSSSLVVAWVQLEARLVNEGKAGWQVSELRTGNREWAKLALMVDALNEAKRKTALTELHSIAAALELFRKDRGFYVISDKEAVVIDHLSPHYLPRVIRVDPWHKPYNYQGDSNRFTLSSSGPDGKEATADDIVVTNTSP